MAANNSGIARIVRRSEEAIVHAGMAILVDQQHIITCCHVINDALRRERMETARPSAADTFEVHFPYANNVLLTAKVEVWGLMLNPPRDVAVLTLNDYAPLPLAEFIDAQLDRKRWSCRGFNVEGNEREVLGEIGSTLADKCTQLNGASGVAAVIEPGYSGSPVWCEEEQAYFGMIVTNDKQHAETRVSYAIPTQIIVEVWPQLSFKRIIEPSNQLAQYAQIIDEDLFVLDRTQLTSDLSRLQDIASQRCVVLVRGARRSGKTHCQYLFQQAANRNGAISVYLDRDLAPTVDDAIQLLFDSINASDALPEPSTKTAANYQLIIRKFRTLALQNGVSLWIVVDDLGIGDDGAPLLDPAVRMFFEEFVLLMKNPAFRSPFRLMLIHYPDGKLPSKWDKNVLIEQTTRVEDIEVQHVIAVLKQLLQMHNLNTADSEIAIRAQEIMRKAHEYVPDPVEPISRLALIHEEVIKVSRDLRGLAQ